MIYSDSDDIFFIYLPKFDYIFASDLHYDRRINTYHSQLQPQPLTPLLKSYRIRKSPVPTCASSDVSDCLLGSINLDFRTDSADSSIAMATHDLSGRTWTYPYHSWIPFGVVPPRILGQLWSINFRILGFIAFNRFWTYLFL